MLHVVIYLCICYTPDFARNRLGRGTVWHGTVRYGSSHLRTFAALIVYLSVHLSIYLYLLRFYLDTSSPSHLPTHVFSHLLIYISTAISLDYYVIPEPGYQS